MDGAPTLAEQLVTTLVLPDVLDNPKGPPEGRLRFRPVHAVGVGATGTFVASEIARGYCVARHFDGAAYPVTVRFSNGLGSRVPHDGWSDVRGMATRFHLSKTDATDLIAMTLPEFFTATPEAFLDFAITAKPGPIKRETNWRKFLDLLKLGIPMPDPPPGQTESPVVGALTYAGRDAHAQLAVWQAATIGAPVSYARATYHAVHAFGIRAPDGVRRFVRFDWRPVAGVLNTSEDDPPKDVYLKQELTERLAREPARFTLMMTIGENGDDAADPSRPWGPHRTRVVMGELTLDTLADDTLIESMSFNPWLLTDGVEPSNDPVLAARRDAYKVSSGRRIGAIPCPFSRSPTDGET